jgi:23S rRNA G2445 N2-methylase RlmL
MDPVRAGYDELYRATQNAVQWQRYLHSGMTVAVHLRMRTCTNWNNSETASHCLYDAIADAIRSKECVFHGSQAESDH